MKPRESNIIKNIDESPISVDNRLVSLDETIKQEEFLYANEEAEIFALEEKINILKKQIQEFYEKESTKIEAIVEEAEILVEVDNEKVIEEVIENSSNKNSGKNLNTNIVGIGKSIVEKLKKKTFKYIILPVAIAVTAVVSYNTPSEYYEMFKNYKERHYDKRQKDDPSIKGIDELYNDSTDVERSTYDFLGEQKIDYKDGYYMTSVFDLGDKTPPRFKIIERGNYNKIDSVSGITTNLFKKFYKSSEFVPELKGHTNKTEEEIGNIPVIGYNLKNQTVRVGSLKEFNDDWLVSETYEIPLNFKLNPDSTVNLVYHPQALRMVPYTINEANKSIPFPVGVTRDKSINKIKPSDCTRFGALEGGKVIMVCEGRQLQVNGSFADIFKVYQKLLKNYPGKSVKAYLLDNGSYNLPIWDKDSIITTAELKKHFNRNYDGGTALCLMNDGKISPYEYKNKYKEYEYFTKNYTLDSITHKPALNEKTVIVLHHTGNYKDPNEIIRQFQDTNYQVSSHCLIMKDGERYLFNTDDYVLAHAGKSDFNDRNKVNFFSLGVEIEGDTKNHHQFTIAQLESLIEYLRPRIEKYGISFENITTHKIIRENYIAKHPDEKGVLPKIDLDDEVWEQIQTLIKKKIYDKEKIKTTENSDKIVSSIMYQDSYRATKNKKYSMNQAEMILKNYNKNAKYVNNTMGWIRNRV